MYARIGTEPGQDPSDAHLLSLLKGGDQTALETLLARHSEALFRYCCHLTSNRHDAEDICQEAMTRAMARVGTLESGDAFRSWLFRIARNASVDWHRRNQRLQPMPEDAPETVPSPTDGPDERVETQEEHQLVAEALSTLKESHQKVLVLREVEGMSYADIARRMNVSQSAVETLLFRARRRLKEQYGKAAFARIGAFAPIRMLAGRVAWPFATGVPVAAKVAVTTLLVGTTALTIVHGASGHRSTPRSSHRHVVASAGAMAPVAQAHLQTPGRAPARRTRAMHVRRGVVRNVSGAPAPLRHTRHPHTRPSLPAVAHHQLSVHVIHPPAAAHAAPVVRHTRHHETIHPRVARRHTPRQKQAATEPSVQGARRVATAVPTVQAPPTPTQPHSSMSINNSSAAAGTTAVLHRTEKSRTPGVRKSGTTHQRHAHVNPASPVTGHVTTHPVHHAHRHAAPPGEQSSPHTAGSSVVSPAHITPAQGGQATSHSGHRHHGAHGTSHTVSTVPSPTPAPAVAGATPATAAQPADAGNNGHAGSPGSSNGQGNGAAASNGQGNGVAPASPQGGSQPSGGNDSPNGPHSAAGQGNPPGAAPGQANRPSTSNGGGAQTAPDPQPTQAPDGPGKGKKP